MAAEGFIAIAPDLLSGKGPGGKGSSSVSKDHARKMIRDLSWEEITRRLDATARYATSLPAATKNVGTVGFCWGGGTSFRYAKEKPELGAAVVYYGVSPGTTTLASIRAPTFRRNQAGQNGANMKAAEKAWPRMVRFLRKTLGE